MFKSEFITGAEQGVDNFRPVTLAQVPASGVPSRPDDKRHYTSIKWRFTKASFACT